MRLLLRVTPGVLAILAQVPSSALAQSFRGPEIYAGTQAAVDIVRTHLELLRAQSLIGRPLTSAALTIRGAPGTYVLADGSEEPGALLRPQLSLTLGFGEVQRFAGYVGVAIDGVLAPSGVFGAGAYEELLHAGVAVRGFQLTYGRKIGGNALTGTDGRGELLPRGLIYRVGTPRAVAVSRDDSDPSGSRGPANFLALYHDLGIYVAATFGTRYYLDLETRTGVEESCLIDLRIQLQPLFEAADQLLRPYVGVPLLGFTRLSSGLEGFVDAVTDDTLAPEEPSYQIDLGTDDLAGLGLRLLGALDVSPEVRFRRAEVGWAYAGPRLTAGARVMLANDDALSLGGDVFGLYTVAVKLTSWLADSPLLVGLSYSYNSPDRSTFIPIRDAHVFGLQLVLGDPGVARPLVPIAPLMGKGRRS